MNTGVKPIGPYFEEIAGLHPYDPAVVLAADEVIGLILDRLPFVDVDHIGSTAVPGLAGRGIIDLMITCPGNLIETFNHKLAELGFQPYPHDSPFNESYPMRAGSYEYYGVVYLIHILILPEDAPLVFEIRTFRDRLRFDQNLQTAYLDCKKSILLGKGKNFQDHTRAKIEFIRQTFK